MKNLEKTLKQIPKSPGIYKYYDKSENIIYIWKSVNLFSRVNSYFNGKSKLNFAKQKMVWKINKIETIVTNNGQESLILELTLIKKHSPKYNILMKDDKNYTYLKITNEEIPKIIKTRIPPKKNQNSWEYFWPYISTNYVNNILKLLKKIFKYRSCNLVFLEKENEISIKSTNGIKIPCIDYYIKRCSGPCLLKKENIREYKKDIKAIKDFLKWDYKAIQKDLEDKMQDHAKALEFEEAKKIKDQIEAINSIFQFQSVRDFVSGDYEVLNYLEKYSNTYVWFMKIRDSKIIAIKNYKIENKLWERKKEILKNFIERETEHKYKIISPLEIDFEEDLWIKVETAKIWNKLELLKLTYKNLFEYAYKEHLRSLSTKWFTKKDQINLLKILGYKQINKNIIFECNDISHLSGTNTVASRSVIENWKTNPSMYRKYNIKTLEELKINDFDSMREVMKRRLKEIIKSSVVPDLIIIDGWKWQLSSVMQVIKTLKKKLKILNLNQNDRITIKI